MFFHDRVGLQVGLLDHRADDRRPRGADPADAQAVQVDAGPAALSPEIKALQAKYKDDKQRLNQEMMKFYQENKVNPFGVVPAPGAAAAGVLLAVLHAAQGPEARHLPGHREYAAEHGRASRRRLRPGRSGQREFLFIPDLTAKATGGVLVVLLVLYVGSQLLSSVLMSVTADRNQRLHHDRAAVRVRRLLIQGFPAGLLVYWITTNLWTVGQQYIVGAARDCRARGAGDRPDRAGAAPVAAQGRASGAPEPTTKAKDRAEAERQRRRGRRRSRASAARALRPRPRRGKKKKTGRRR